MFENIKIYRTTHLFLTSLLHNFNPIVTKIVTKKKGEDHAT